MVSHTKNYFEIKNKTKEWENLQRSLIISRVLFQIVCNVNNIRNFIFLFYSSYSFAFFLEDYSPLA